MSRLPSYGDDERDYLFGVGLLAITVIIGVLGFVTWGVTALMR